MQASHGFHCFYPHTSIPPCFSVLRPILLDFFAGPKLQSSEWGHLQSPLQCLLSRLLHTHSGSGSRVSPELWGAELIAQNSFIFPSGFLCPSLSVYLNPQFSYLFIFPSHSFCFCGLLSFFKKRLYLSLLACRKKEKTITLICHLCLFSIVVCKVLNLWTWADVRKVRSRIGKGSLEL